MYYNFGDHTTDMNKEALHGLNEVMKVYVPVASYHINDASGKQTLGKGIFRCRFCGKAKPEASFASKAHAIPHFISNNVLFTDVECDSCNGKFGRLLETQYAAFMHLEHTVSGIRGKNGYPKYKTSDATIETTGSFVDWSNIPNENLHYDHLTGTATIKQKRPTFIPIAVYKCLVKIAISLLPEAEIEDFVDTIRWLNEVDHQSSEFHFKSLWMVHGTASSTNRFADLSAIVVKRTEHASPNMPCMMLRLTYGNFLFQVPVPLCNKDDPSLKMNIPYIPNLLDLELGYGQMKLTLMDMHSSEKIKGAEINFTITDLDGSGTYQLADKNE
jgi:hypothetical protein